MNLPAILRGDALHLPLRDSSVDLIISSPPYHGLRSYRDNGEHYDGQIGSESTPAEFLVALWRVLDECWRVLKPTGSCWINLGDRYAGSGGHNNSNLSRWEHAPLQGGKRTLEANSALVNAERNAARRNAPDRYNQSADVLPKSVMGLPWRFALGAACPDPYRTVYEPGDHPQWINRRPTIWHKPNGLPESVTDRCRANFEDWFMLVKQGRYFSAVDEIREPHAPRSVERTQRNRFAPDLSQEGVGGPNTLDPVQMCNPLGKLPGSVWTVATEPLIIPDAVRAHYRLPDHFAAFPTEWPRRIILGWSPSGICTACGEGRRPIRGRDCEQCGSVVESHTKTCLECGHRRGNEWQADRVSTADHRTENGKPGLHVPRRAKPTTITGPSGTFACACPEPSAPTRPARILDPFCGTGTVPGVAHALGRTGIGVDLSGDYCRLAAWRTRHSNHFAKAASRTDAERQGNLLDFAADGPATETASR